MSATVVYIDHTAVHLVTDGAGCDPEGRLERLIQKVAILPHKNAALTARGPASFLFMLQTVLMEHQGGFDQLRCELTGLADQALTILADAMDQQSAAALRATRVDVVVVGWSSERGRPEAYLAALEPATQAWTVEVLEGKACQYLSPSDPPVMERLRSEGVDLFADKVETAKHGLAVMRAVRATMPFVGGFCQMTTVMENLTFSRILERWPDQVGEFPGR